MPKASLTYEDKEIIRTMFWGPYKEEWKDKEGVVDNSDRAIANRLGMDFRVVGAFTARDTIKHFKQFKI